jgi:hypothetical protein
MNEVSILGFFFCYVPFMFQQVMCNGPEPMLSIWTSMKCVRIFCHYISVIQLLHFIILD